MIPAQLESHGANSADIDTMARAFFAMCWIMTRNCASEPQTILWARNALDALLICLAETLIDGQCLEAALLAIEEELLDMRAALADDAAADGALLGLADRVAAARRVVCSPSPALH